MKRWKIVLLSILGVFVLFVTAFTIWQFDNIRAVIKAFTSTPEQIAQEMNENKKKLEEELKMQNIEVVRDFTEKEKKQIIKI